jgi:hypothetical protein
LVLSIALLSGTGSVLLTTDLSTEQVSTFIADLICSQLENQGKRLAPWISVCLHQLTNTWILISLCRGVEYILRITKYVGRSYSCLLCWGQRYERSCRLQFVKSIFSFAKWFKHNECFCS